MSTYLGLSYDLRLKNHIYSFFFSTVITSILSNTDYLQTVKFQLFPI